MTNGYMIQAQIYSYRNKDLKNAVMSFIDNTESEYHLHIIDQHPLYRKHLFADIPNVNYRHVFWDHIYSPISYKPDHMGKDISDNAYSLIFSDDVIFSKGWESQAVEFLQDKPKVILSGRGSGHVEHKDKYFIHWVGEDSETYNLTHYFDRNFIFAKTALLQTVEFPTYMKYLGENEMLSLDTFTKGYDVYSVPSSLYDDLGARTIENLYLAYSIEHFYNNFVDTIKGNRDVEKYEGRARSVAAFLEFHNIDLEKIRLLWYQEDDVLYDPNALQIQNAGGERFVATTKAIL